jgi:hypothetical protein
VINDVPEPIYVPPQLVAYQFQFADVPSVPPDTLKVALSPAHIVVGVTEEEFAADDTVNINTYTLTQAVVLQVPSALIQ